MATKSIMIVGVGGQGSLLASKLLGRVLLAAGHDVKVSEVHGMAQRGGSVVTYVKYGEKVYSPVIEQGEADIIVSFELCEAARWLAYLKQGGRLVTGDQQIPPMPVITGAARYPEDVARRIAETGSSIQVVDALSLARRAGSAKAVNVVMMGVLSTLMEFDRQMWQQALEEAVPARFLEMNKTAFALGREAAISFA